MTIKRGTRTNQRRNAKNFTQAIAQKRLDETVEPFNRQVQNSLAVDAVQIDYYHIQRKVGTPCTCGTVQKTPIVGDSGGAHPLTVRNRHSEHENASVVFQEDNIFGDNLAELIYEDSGDTPIDVSGTSVMEIPATIEDESIMNGGSVNCGICYRTQHLPPYKANNKQRFLFTSHEIAAVDQYFVNTTEAPHTIESHGQFSNGSVAFELTVPKYFKDVVFSVRDNIRYIAGEKLWDTHGRPLSVQELRHNAGRTITFFVKAPKFTHVVVEFGIDVEPMYANISQESMALDYGRLMTIGDIQVVLPPTLHGVENGDILIVKKRNLALMVRDKEWKATADRRTFGWRVSTRVLQPSEPMRTLNAGIKLL